MVDSLRVVTGDPPEEAVLESKFQKTKLNFLGEKLG